MRSETIQTDIAVIGGGLAGVCAAIAAARLGQTVSLIQNRPVLGGNASSEVRVWVCGATGHGINRYARETGIMGELFVENQYRNPDGNPYLWDLVVLEAVKAEKNIQLFLNTDVHEVEASGSAEERSIDSVTGWMMGSERRIRFESRMFLDCTGDGLVGFLAGAEYRIGREAKHEYREEWAPEIADNITLGSTILFYTKDVGHPVKYVPPSFAKDIMSTSIPMKRVIRSGDSGCHYWWIEWGGELDTVHENEQIRDELSAVIYGIWDYIKNSGNFEADNMTLEWVGSLPGKREYRRFVGDYVINQNDVVTQEPFEDRVAFGGWSIDLHPPQGMYAEESGSKHYHMDGIYHIPFRSLYSHNVSNLMFAGRDISATHVAFGTTRVMATCAVIGEAAGTGAALCSGRAIQPRELHKEHLELLQQTLLRQDASVIGIHSNDLDDLVRTASISASSTMKSIDVSSGSKSYDLVNPVGVLFPVEPRLDSIEWLLDAKEDTQFSIEIWDTGKSENYIPANLIFERNISIKAGDQQWVDMNVNWIPEQPQNVFVIVKPNSHIRLYLSEEPVFGILSFENKVSVTRDFGDHKDDQKVMQWSMKSLNRKLFCIKVKPETAAYNANKIKDGYMRPYGGPHLWLSDQVNSSQEEWVCMTWLQPKLISEIRITFNDDVNEDLINLHHHTTAFDIIPELVKDYRIEAWNNGEWALLLRVTHNRKRNRIHRFNQPYLTHQVRIVIEATNGSTRVGIIDIRAYE